MFFTLNAVVNNVILKQLIGFFGDMNVATLHRIFLFTFQIVKIGIFEFAAT